MNKSFLIILVCCVFFSSCIRDDQFWMEDHTLSGTVSSAAPHHAFGLFDGVSFGEDYLVQIMIQYKSHETKAIYICMEPYCNDITALPDDTVIFGDVYSLETSSFPIQGELGNVKFDDKCELQITQRGRSKTVSVAGTVKGWIINTAFKTKIYPNPLDYSCDIEIEWDDESSGSPAHHKLIINRITWEHQQKNV